MAKQDYYSVLGMRRDASDKELKQAYRRLARQYHPDVNPGDSAAEQKFKEISEARRARSRFSCYGTPLRDVQTFDVLAFLERPEILQCRHGMRTRLTREGGVATLS